MCVNMRHLFSLKAFGLLFLKVFLPLLPQSFRLLFLSRLLLLFLIHKHSFLLWERQTSWMPPQVHRYTLSDLFLESLCLLSLFLKSLFLVLLLLLLLLRSPLLCQALSLLLSLCSLLGLTASHLLLREPVQSRMQMHIIHLSLHSHRSHSYLLQLSQRTSPAPPVACAPLPLSLSAHGPAGDSQPGFGSPPLDLWCLLRACMLGDCLYSLKSIKIKIEVKSR